MERLGWGKEGKNKRQTHGSTETAIYFEDGELVEVGGVLWLWEIGIGDNLVFGGGLDTIPIAERVSEGGRRMRERGRTDHGIEHVLRDSG